MCRFYRALCVIFLVLASAFSFAQSKSLDSLYERYRNTKSDTQTVNTLNAIFSVLCNNNSDSALQVAQEALMLSEKINYLRGKQISCNNLGIINYYKDNYTQALKFYIRTCSLLEGAKGKDKGEDLDNKKMLSTTYNNMGTIFIKQKQYAMAENYFRKSVVIDIILGDKKGLSSCYNNLGIIKEETSQYEEALNYYDKSLKIKIEAGDSSSIPSTLINMGIVAMNQKKYKESLEYLERADEMAVRTNNQLDRSLALINSGDVYYEQKKYHEAISFYEKGIVICEKESYHNYASYAFQNISLAYGRLKNFEKAFDFYQKYTSTKDSIYNHDNARMLNELAARYESESKEKEIKLLTSEKGIQELELNKNRIMIISFSICLILFAGFVVFVLYAYRQKRNANRELDGKNKKIEQAYSLIEDKQKEILDSIHYAKRIQHSLLPNETFFDKELERLSKKT